MSPPAHSGYKGLSIYIPTNVTQYTCLNLVDLVNNDQTVGNSSRMHEQDGVRWESTQGWPDFQKNFDPSVRYHSWGIALGFHAPIENDLKHYQSANMQVNIYGESDCKNKTIPWIGYSCDEIMSANAGWSMKSFSLQPNTPGQAKCLFNATDGVVTKNAGARNPVSGFWSAAVVALAVVAAAVGVA